jgi:hypothetical protein
MLGSYPLAVSSEFIYDDDDDEQSFERLKHHAGDKGVRPDLSTQRHAERSVVEDPSVPSVDCCVNSTEEDSHPLPRAWMTRSASEEEHHMRPPLGRDADTKNKPPISIIALAKVAVLHRRWIRKKHPPIGTTDLVFPEDCSILTADIFPDKILNASNIPERNHAGYVFPNFI